MSSSQGVLQGVIPVSLLLKKIFSVSLSIGSGVPDIQINGL